MSLHSSLTPDATQAHGTDFDMLRVYLDEVILQIRVEYSYVYMIFSKSMFKLFPPDSVVLRYCIFLLLYKVLQFDRYTLITATQRYVDH